MRKLLWLGTAAAIVTVAGVFTAAQYVCCHPESALCRGVLASSLGSALLSRSAEPSCTAEECEVRPIHEEAGYTPLPELDRPPDPIVIPDDAAAPEDAVEECTGEQVEPEPIAPSATLCPPARLERAVPEGPTAAAFPDEHDSACPMIMPYCHDEDGSTSFELPPMPRAHEVMHNGSCEHAEPWGGAAPTCQEDPHYFEHYSGCPYTSPRPPAVPPRKEKSKGDCEGCEPAPKLHKTFHHGGAGADDDAPRHPEVDTMEYRKSDGNLNEYGQGPY